MRTFTLSTSLATLLLTFSTAAFAGTPFAGTGATPEEAMDAATKAVEEAARKKGTCVSEYPDLKKCTQEPDGSWKCVGIRANKKGSCK